MKQVKIFPVLEMSCAACAVSVESIVAGQEGVKNASVNYAGQTLQVEYDDTQTTPNALRQAVQSIGYDLIIEEENAAEKQQEQQQAGYRQLKRETIGAGLLALPVFVLGMFFPHLPFVKWIMLLLAAPAVFWFGRRFFVHAWKQARHRQANMDTLVALSTGIAFLFSTFNTVYPEFWLARGLEAHVYFEAAAVIVFFILLGKLLEERAKASTSSAIKKLMGLQPATVVRVQPDGSFQDIPLAHVSVGDRLLTRPGDKVAVDGVVASGESYIDESMISGEPIPVYKSAGERVFAGTINQKGSFEFVAEKVGADTLLAQIIRTVREAQGSKAPVQKLADRVAGIFVPVVLSIAVLTFVLWLLFGGDNALTYALLNSVTVLVIACPCALGLATPTAIIAGVGRGAGQGILIKDAQSLETAHRVTDVVLDKTGTLTEGRPKVTEQHWLTDRRDELEQILLALESRSEHPLATAIVNAIANKPGEILQVTNFESATGLGVRANVGSRLYRIGSRAYMQKNQVHLDAEIESLAQRWRDDTRTVVYFAEEQSLAALLSISDPLKPSAEPAIKTLLKDGLSIHLLSGDSPETAANVARKINIPEAHGGLAPTGKSAYIRQLQKEGKVVAMVGDGINDAEAMALADVSIAMGQGSEIAIETAKMALLTSDLEQLPKAFHLSKKTVRTIWQNLFWAFIYNVIGIPIAAGVLFPFTGFLLNPMVAGAAMALSSVSVVTNSLRLRRVRL